MRYRRSARPYGRRKVADAVVGKQGAGEGGGDIIGDQKRAQASRGAGKLARDLAMFCAIRRSNVLSTASVCHRTWKRRIYSARCE